MKLHTNRGIVRIVNKNGNKQRNASKSGIQTRGIVLLPGIVEVLLLLPGKS
jgi:hypothetical protein